MSEIYTTKEQRNALSRTLFMYLYGFWHATCVSGQISSVKQELYEIFGKLSVTFIKNNPYVLFDWLLSHKVY